MQVHLTFRAFMNMVPPKQAMVIQPAVLKAAKALTWTITATKTCRSRLIRCVPGCPQGARDTSLLVVLYFGVYLAVSVFYLNAVHMSQEWLCAHFFLCCSGVPSTNFMGFTVLSSPQGLLTGSSSRGIGLCCAVELSERGAAQRLREEGAVRCLPQSLGARIYSARDLHPSVFL